MGRYKQISRLFWFFLAVYICIESIRLPLGSWHDPGPGFIPLWSGILLGSLSLISYFRARFTKSEDTGESWYFGGRWRNLVLVVGVLIAYAFLLEILGYLLSTFILMVFLFRGIEPQRWVISIGGGAIISIITYSIFDLLLGTQLPRGIFGF